MTDLRDDPGPPTRDVGEPRRPTGAAAPAEHGTAPDETGWGERGGGDVGPSSSAAAPGLGVVAAGVLVLVLAVLAGGIAGRAGLFGPPLSGGVAVVPTSAPSAATPAPASPSGTVAQPSASAGAASPSGSPGAASPSAPATPVAATIGPGASVPPDAPANFGLVWEALDLVREHYVDRSALDPTRLTYGAISGIVAALGDPGHSVFLTPEDLRSEQQSLSGELEGIGAVIAVESGVPIIASVITDSPAERAGLRPGDQIIAVDGDAAEGLTIPELVRRIRGPAGTTVTLTIIPRDSATPIQVGIVRARITVPAVLWTAVPGHEDVAVIRLVQFSQGASGQFADALADARAAGATRIVLDLRSNPGGLVDEAVGVASQLIEDGTVYVRRTAGGEQIPVPVRPDVDAVDLPLVVLVDYGSASSAEILAGAVQDNDRGPVIGTRTLGTGTVLNTFPLSDGSALRIGVERWLTPSGEGIFPNGITPDEPVELDGDARPLDPGELRGMTPEALEESGDAQLLRALDILAE